MSGALGEIGGFELIEELGRGGMGVVYRARDHALKRDLAVKLLGGEWLNDLLMLQRFVREAQILASINHPHVISIYAVGEHLGSPYFAMELLEHSISDACKLKTPTLAQLKRWMLEAARGLGALHERGIIHRDIKPGNLLLTKANSLEPERVKVADLGIASSGNLFGPRLTQLGSILGTTGYLAPEAMQPGLILDARADQYSLGVVFFELLARRAPFTDVERATAIRSANATTLNAPDIRQGRPDIDAATAQLITRMLEFDRNARFPDTQTLIAELQNVQAKSAGAEIAAAPRVAPPYRPAGTPVQERPENQPSGSQYSLGGFWALAIAAVLLVTAILWFNATPVRAVAKPIAGRTAKAPTVDAARAGGSEAESPDPDTADKGARKLGEIKGRSGARAPELGLVPDGESETELTDSEGWAKALLARYLLSSHGPGKTAWALVLIDQKSGVIAAQLSGPENESQQFSGTVTSHHIEIYDDVPWDIYKLSLKNTYGQSIEMQIECTESLISGGGVYLDQNQDDGQDNRRSFDIESSE